MAELVSKKDDGDRIVDGAADSPLRIIGLIEFIGQALLAAEMDTQGLDACTAAMVQSTEAALVQIWAYDYLRNHLQLQSANAGQITFPKNPQIDMQRLAQLYAASQDYQPYICQSALGDVLLTDQEWAEREKIVSFAFYPLVVEKKLSGILALYAQCPLTEAALLAASVIANELTLGLDRKRAQEAQQDSAAWKGALLQASLDAIITINAQQQVTDWNSAAEEMFGYRRADATGQALASLIIPAALRDAHLKGFARYLKTGEGRILNRRIEVTALRADGSEFPAELTVVPILVDGNRLFTAFVRDISVKQQVEQTIQESEIRYRTLINATAQIVWTNTPEGEMRGPNPDWEEYTGQKEAEYQGYGWADALHPDDREATVAAWQEAVQARSLFLFEHRLRRRDGEYRIFLVRAVPILDKDGTIREWTGVHTDVTERRVAEAERRQAEDALRQSQQRYKSLFDYNPDAVFSFDLTGQFKSANSACQTVSGYAPEELLGITFMPLIVPEDLDRVLVHFQGAAQGNPQTFETDIRRKNGDRVSLAVTIVPTVVDDQIVGVFGIAEDISERKRAESLEREAHLRQRLLLRDVLASVTESKLLLVDSPEQLPRLGAPFGEAIFLTRESGLQELRQDAQNAGRHAGLSLERQYDLITAASEAGMNAITHGGGSGTAQVYVHDQGRVQVRVVDQGVGITMENLPRATLARGFSTKATLGHGLKMILETVDRIYLLTGPTGTTVMIEQERDPPLPPWLEEAIS